jgi:LacI family transcriptional regulator
MLEEGGRDHMKKRVDLGTIAQQVGVSKTTVHYALHQPERLGKATLEKVLAAVKESGYRPNLLARSLRTRRSNVIGVLYTRSNYSRFVPFFEATAQVAEEHGYALFAATSGGCPARERELVELALALSADGVIILPSESQENHDFYRGLVEEQSPIVFVENTVPGMEADWVGTDGSLGGQIAARRLLEVGRRQVAFLAPGGDEGDHQWVRARREGFSQAVTEAGFGPVGEVEQDPAADTTSLERCGYEATRRCLASGLGYDGIFAANDRLAWGAMKASSEAGRRVGDDLSVVGFDDDPSDEYLDPPLSSLRPPFAAIGQEAMRLMLQRIQDPAAVPTRTVFAPALVIRSSCAR